MVWTQSSAEPAGQQEGSSDQFLWKNKETNEKTVTDYIDTKPRGHVHHWISVIFSPSSAVYYKPSASRAISCRRPVVPRSMPVLSSSSLSRNELAVDESERSVTWPTFIGRPANSKPFSCSKAFFAHSASANLGEKEAV